jgi:peptidoglycan L-alanyl-D-glutamate endopeptidase CwlK
MSNYSLISKKKLESCHPDLQAIFFYVILGYDNTIVCGHRGEQEQNQAFAAGNSQLQWPNSKHNSYPSMAVDAVPYETNHLDWGKTQMANFAGYVKGIADLLFRMSIISHHVRCGIDWNGNNDIDDTKFVDAGHFELIEP